MKKYLCIHGHFYQPPRENPWTGEIGQQISAAPYANWNERISVECYFPNVQIDLSFGQGQENYFNNYSHMSFNFGPTLFSWLKRHLFDLYEEIIQSDKESMEFFSGHGAAIAQCYSHMIMPLANHRDRETQIIWGIKDFEFRFSRYPEGMWLPETAVDIETLEILASHDIKYTILSPSQALKVRKIGDPHWHDASHERVHTDHVYMCPLPSGKSINVFFYNGPLSHEVAFGHLLTNGERFAHRIREISHTIHNPSGLIHLATDGETYGHHHKNGHTALAQCLSSFVNDPNIALTVYGEYLQKFPAQHEVIIRNFTSWSCAHGIERWRDHCGCALTFTEGWNQQWRKYLRIAIDWLRDELAEMYEETMAEFFDDPWQARNDYIEIILNSHDDNVDRVLKSLCKKDISKKDEVVILKLLEMQKDAMLMYTSCGWFFDDVSGLEVKQILQYSARAIQIAKDVLQKDLEPGFLDLLKLAKSNIDEIENGKNVYEQLIRELRS